MATPKPSPKPSLPVEHVAGIFAWDVQVCSRCGELLVDYRNTAWPEGQEPPRGWREGERVVVGQESRALTVYRTRDSGVPGLASLCTPPPPLDMPIWLVWCSEYPDDGSTAVKAWTEKGAFRRYRWATIGRGKPDDTDLSCIEATVEVRARMKVLTGQEVVP